MAVETKSIIFSQTNQLCQGPGNCLREPVITRQVVKLKMTATSTNEGLIKIQQVEERIPTCKYATQKAYDDEAYICSLGTANLLNCLFWYQIPTPRFIIDQNGHLARVVSE